MNILDIAIVKQLVGGGGSGTDNYNDLSNLPQINGETLSGNKSAENLGLQDALTFDSSPTEDSTNPVESGGVYTALAGKQDNLTFDDDPTENSTNPVKSGGVYSALAGKQDNLTFDGVYNASTNKAATESTVTNAIAGLDVSAFSVDADETISNISETDGKISVTKQDIAIASNQVVAMTGYTKPSSAPATPAIQPADTANAAIGKLEYKADVNQTNILYNLQTGVKNLLDSDTYDAINNMTYANGTCTAIYSEGDTLSNLKLRLRGTMSSAIAVSSLAVQTITSNGIVALEFTKTNAYDGIIVQHASGGTGENSSMLYDFPNLPDGDYVFQCNVINCDHASGNYQWNQMMICTLDAWNQSHDYQPYALPNADLTQLESEDRAALADVVDSGAKNKLPITDITPTGIYNNPNLTCTNNGDGTYTLNGECVTNCQIKLRTDIIASSYGNSILSGCPRDLNSSGAAAMLAIYTNNDNSGVCFDYGDSAEIPSSFVDSNLSIFVFAGHTFNNALFKPMICSKAAFDVSPAFVPYTLKQPRIIYQAASPTLSDTETIVTDLNYTIPANVTARITVTQAYNNAIPTAIRIAWDNAMIPSHTYAYVENSNNIGLLSTSMMTKPNIATTLYISAKAAQSGSNNIYMLIELFE